MKLLILVLSYNEPPYDELMRTQQATWDSVEVDGVKTVYYYGGGKGWVNEKEFSADTDDLYYRMHWKLALVLKEIEKWEWRPDIIWRTNSSSYINKGRLYQYAHTFPIVEGNIYAGWKIDGPDYSICSGAGFFMTPDLAKIIVDKFDGEMNCEEDCLIGRTFSEMGVTIFGDQSRYDVPSEFLEIPTDRYHYRLKTSDRKKDAENMRKIHQQIINAK